jgi:hypothetical protein
MSAMQAASAKANLVRMLDFTGQRFPSLKDRYLFG